MTLRVTYIGYYSFRHSETQCITKRELKSWYRTGEGIRKLATPKLITSLLNPVDLQSSQALSCVQRSLDVHLTQHLKSTRHTLGLGRMGKGGTKFVGEAISQRSGRKHSTYTSKELKKDMEKFLETGVHPDWQRAQQARLHCCTHSHAAGMQQQLRWHALSQRLVLPAGVNCVGPHSSTARVARPRPPQAICIPGPGDRESAVW